MLLDTDNHNKASNLISTIDVMKFPLIQKQADQDETLVKQLLNDDLVKPLLSKVYAGDVDPKFKPPVAQDIDNFDIDRSAFPVRYQRRSTLVRHMAHKKNSMRSSEFRKLFSEDDDSEYIGFSIGHSIDSTITTANLRTLTGSSILEKEEKAFMKDDHTPMTTLVMIKMTLVFTITMASVFFYSVALAESYVEETSALSLSFLAVAGGVSLFVAPLVCAREWTLARCSGVRDSISALRGEASFLGRKIQYLQVEVAELKAETERLEQGNVDLNRHAAKQGIASSNIVKLVRENKEILSEMQEYLREAVLQNVIKEILRSDFDRDGMLNRRERTALATSLELSLGAYGIVFDVEKFHRAIGLSPSLMNTMTIVKRLIPDKDNRLSSFYSAMSDSISESHTSEQENLFDLYYIPIRRAFENTSGDDFYLKDDQHYITLRSPLTQSTSFSIKPSNCGILKNVKRCPTCPDCPYCIGKANEFGEDKIAGCNC